MEDFKAQMVIEKLSLIEEHLRALVNLKVEKKAKEKVEKEHGLNAPDFYKKIRENILKEIYQDYRPK